MSGSGVSHRERLLACLAGEAPDRPPVALWRHFPVDDQAPDSLASAMVDFQLTYDFDLVKVTPASSFCLQDWGARDEWRGATEGTRDYTYRVVQSPADWGRLPVLDPFSGALGAQLECLRLIQASLGPDTPVIQTIFSPLSQAKNLAGGTNLLLHLRRYPDELREGLRVIAESTRRFIAAAAGTGIAGIFYAVQHAQYSLLSQEEYSAFGLQDDRELCEAAGEMWFNLLHLHGQEVMFDLFIDFPIQSINWHDRETAPNLGAAGKVFPGVLCGGLQREQTLVLGTPEAVMAEAQEAVGVTGGKRFILSTGCVLPVITPRANILAARRSVEMMTSVS